MNAPSQPLRVVIACGGTGGHLFPGIAVGQVLLAQGHEVLLLISEKKVDAVAAEAHPELKFQTVAAIGFPRLYSPRLMAAAWRFWTTYRATRRVLQEFKADAVLGMGGFTSLPPALAGRRLGMRTFIHESNAIPGKANRLTARFSDFVLLGMAECARHFPNKETRVVGTPLRAAMLETSDRAQNFPRFGLDPTKSTVLVMGGSQGARGVNRAMIASLSVLDSGGTQLLWLTGREDEDEVRAALAGCPLQAFMAPFHPHLEQAYSVADVCVARSGASSLAELAHFGIPTILIPLPTAAEDHQTKNALVYSRQEAAILLPQSEATQSLGPLILDLLRHKTRRLALRTRIQTMSSPNAARSVAEVVVLETLHKRRPRA